MDKRERPVPVGASAPDGQASRDAFAAALLGDLDPVARRIVSAARERFADQGFAETTMQDIARSAGVGVATVYRRFGQRRTLVHLAILDEAMRLGGRLAEVQESARGPEELVVETFATLITEASAPKLLTRNIRRSPEAAELSAVLNDKSIIELGRSSIAAALRPYQESGALPDHLDLEVIGEILARLTNSLVDSPQGSAIPMSDPDRAREFAESYLVPLLQTRRR